MRERNRGDCGAVACDVDDAPAELAPPRKAPFCASARKDCTLRMVDALNLAAAAAASFAAAAAAAADLGVVAMALALSDVSCLAAPRVSRDNPKPLVRDMDRRGGSAEIDSSMLPRMVVALTRTPATVLQSF